MRKILNYCRCRASEQYIGVDRCLAAPVNTTCDASIVQDLACNVQRSGGCQYVSGSAVKAVAIMEVPRAQSAIVTARVMAKAVAGNVRATQYATIHDACTNCPALEIAQIAALGATQMAAMETAQIAQITALGTRQGVAIRHINALCVVTTHAALMAMVIGVRARRCAQQNCCEN